MTQADDLRVCPICWVHHADYTCPRSAESEALYTTLTHLLEGGAAPAADLPMDPTSTNISSGMAETGDVDMDVDAQAGNIDDIQQQSAATDPQDVTDVEVEEAATDDAGDEPPTVLPEAKPRAKARPIRKLTSNKMSSDESADDKSVRFLVEEEDVSPLDKSRELESMDISNIQQLKNQVPQFLEYANPRPFHSGHFINSEGEVDWTRGRPPLTGRVRSLKALELMVSTLQRDEDREGIDYDFGGTTKYLDQKCEQNLVATLIDNRTGRIRFLDKSYHCLGKWGDKNCEFYGDEIYHAGKRLSIWLRHIWLRGSHSTNVDRGGWASIDQIIQDEDFWRDVHRELLRHGHDHRKNPDYAISYDKDNMRKQPTLDVLMCHRTWLIALIIDNELWNWGRDKKRMEFTGARIHPQITDEQLIALLGTLLNPAGVGSAAEACALPYSGWVRPLAVRCVSVSGHSNSAVDLELTTIPITDKVMDAVGGAWHITSRFNLLWIARDGLLPGGPRRWRADIHFSAFAPWDLRYRSSFTNRFAYEGEKGMVIYVPITALKEMGARLASNGVILCRDKIPFTATQAIFELDGTRGMGSRIQSPSLVDEYVCESMFGEDCTRASPKYIKKVAEQYKDNAQQRIIGITTNSNG